MNKEKSYKEQKTEKERGKKRYIERLVETKEAEQHIQEYLDSPEEEEKENENRTILRPFS